MQKFYKLFLAFIVSITCFSANAQKFFSDVSEGSITDNSQRVIVPQKYRTTVLNNADLKNFLWSLPQENSVNRNTAPILELPSPYGGVARFRVWESSIMEPGLSAKFPEIKTFAGQGIDDPAANIRFSYDPYFGFAAQILSPEGVSYIDAYSRGNIKNYISYYGRDHVKTRPFVCETNEQLPLGNRVAAGPCRGTQLYSYRIAIACTGEYAVAATGVATPTTAQTLAKIVFTTNRVNGVYENDLSIRIILIANNDLIVFTSAASDPFNGNNNANTLINESQTVITNLIGAANFDIGHTFSTGGGGLAGLGVVCNASSKARGITGSPSPTGDGYDIDYVAHEVGHQFGGSHTFNSSLVNCGGGNRSAAQAYEVGSGTTIMAYAGICGADDIQPNSDPYFHAISFDQISTFVETGGGAACKVATPTGNTLPVITSMTGGGSNIPLGTPFLLSATATDADGNTLSYSWEEWDLGTTTVWNGGNEIPQTPPLPPLPNTASPLFKSRTPLLTGSRSFPSLAVINAGYPTSPAATPGGLKGETMPTLGRTMKFRVTVRDNRAGGGGVVSGGDGCQISSSFTVTTIDGTGPFVVTVPNGGESYAGGSTQNITWNVAGTNAGAINVANVKITMSTDGGVTYPIVLAASTPNDGTEALTIPIGTTTTARVKIEAVGNIFYDFSNANFIVTGPAAPTFVFNNVASTTVACGSVTTATSSLGSTAITGFSTQIALAATAGVPAGTTVSFSANPLTPGNATNVTLNNVNTLTPGTYTITVTGTAGAEIRTAPVTFIVQPGAGPSFTTQPSAQTVCVGTNATFTSAATGASGYQWQVNTGTGFTNISGANSASYTVTGTTGSQNGHIYQVIASTQCGSTTSSTALLNVTTAAAITTQPASTSACTGGTASFTVVAAGTSLTYVWEVSTDGGATWSVVPSATGATLNLTALTAGQNGNQYRVKISNSCATATSSAATLTVNNTAAILTQPVAQNVCSGSSISFSISAVGTGLGYQWQVSNDGGTTWTNIPGANAATFAIPNVPQALNNTRYRVSISNICSATALLSNAVLLTVFTPVTIDVAPPREIRGCVGDDITISVSATGSGLSYQWNESVNGGATYTAIPGATSSSFTITNLARRYDGYLYTVTVTGVPCGVITTLPTLIRANFKPGVVLAPATPNTAITPSSNTTLYATVSPVAPATGSFVYNWTLNNQPIAATGSSVYVTPDELGTYTVTVTDTSTGCSSTSNAVTISDAISNAVFIYPNPNIGRFQVRYYGPVTGNTVRTVNVYDSKGSRVLTKTYSIARTYEGMDVDMRNMNTGIYMVELKDASGKRLGSASVIVK